MSAGTVAARTSGSCRLAPTASPHSAAIFPILHAPIARAYGMMVLTLREDRVSAITWFGERSLFAHFGLPRTLPD